MTLILNITGNTTFLENVGSIANLIAVEKENASLETEVDIPINVTITGEGTAFAGKHT